LLFLGDFCGYFGVFACFFGFVVVFGVGIIQNFVALVACGKFYCGLLVVFVLSFRVFV